MAAIQVYLDVSTLSRSFDDQSQARIRLETEAAALILAHVRLGTLELMVSPVHNVEINANPDVEERSYLRLLLERLGVPISADHLAVRERAEALADAGMGVADAAHVAFAEAAEAAFITVDDRLRKQCRRLAVKVWYGTPLAFCDKENLR